MSYKILESDITTVKADAIVFSANPEPLCGNGMDLAVYKAAGADYLIAARKKIGAINRGEAAHTPAFKLDANYLIHTVGPVWRDGTMGEFDTLRSCYINSINLAITLGCKTVAVPLISSGVYGFPRYKVLQTATEVFDEISAKNDIEILLVVYDRTCFDLTPEDMALLDRVNGEYKEARYRERRMRGNNFHAAGELEDKAKPGTTKALTLDDVLRQKEESFAQKLFALIDARGLKDADVYKKVKMPRQTFSKIRSQADYHPSKFNALILCLSLELTLDESEDLLGRAGYMLSTSNKTDLIIRHCIMTSKYSIMDINKLLEANNLSALEKMK